MVITETPASSASLAWLQPRSALAARICRFVITGGALTDSIDTDTKRIISEQRGIGTGASPMAQPRLTRVMPGFADVFETAEYYRDVLGFTFDGIWGNPPSFVMLDRDDVRLSMRQVGPEAAPARPAGETAGVLDVYLYTTDVRALAEELKKRGADIVEGPVDRTIYNGRELIVRDLNGLTLCFGQLLDEHPD